MDTSTIVRNAQMDLLIELDRICRKQGISYFLTYGTLLGAIRHNGFIPWDDDLDVGMRWDHLEAFCKACETELDAEYFLHSYATDPRSPHPFYKLKIRNTHYPEKLAEKSGMNDGIYIDIFPYDSVPQGKFAQKRQKLETYLLYKILLLRCDFDLAGQSKVKKVLYGTLKFLSRIRSLDSWHKAATRARTRYNDGTAEYVTNMYSGYDYEREAVPCQMLDTVITHTFENGEFAVPAEYDKFLRQIYGDYMQLPPEEQRVGGHEIQGLDLGGYQIRCR